MSLSWAGSFYKNTNAVIPAQAGMTVFLVKSAPGCSYTFGAHTVADGCLSVKAPGTSRFRPAIAFFAGSNLFDLMQAETLSAFQWRTAVVPKTNIRVHHKILLFRQWQT